MKINYKPNPNEPRHFLEWSERHQRFSTYKPEQIYRENTYKGETISLLMPITIAKFLTHFKSKLLTQHFTTLDIKQHLNHFLETVNS